MSAFSSAEAGSQYWAFQVTASKQRKLDQLFPIHLLSLHRKECAVNNTRCHTDLSGNRADQDLAAVCLTKGDSSCGPSVVLSSQQMHMAGDNPNNLELRSAPVCAEIRVPSPSVALT